MLIQTLVITGLSLLCGILGLKIADDDPRSGAKILFALMFTFGLMLPTSLVLLSGN